MGAVNVTIIDSTGSRRQEARLPDDRAVGAIVERLVAAMALPTREPSGAPLSYRFIDTATGRQIWENETLAGANVREGSELRLAPVARPENHVVPGPPLTPPRQPLAPPSAGSQGNGPSLGSLNSRFRSWPSQARYGTIAAVVLVLYLIIAGAGSLPPFSKTSTTTTTSPPSSTSTTAGGPLDTAQQQLAALIPGNVYGATAPGRSSSNCKVSNGQVSGVTPAAEFTCDLGSDKALVADAAIYASFSSLADLDDAYSSFLAGNSQTENSGDCATFASFTSCETPWNSTQNSNLSGRIVEFTGTNNLATLAWTVQGDDLMVLTDSSADNGNSLLQWWDHNEWIANA